MSNGTSWLKFAFYSWLIILNIFNTSVMTDLFLLRIYTKVLSPVSKQVIDFVLHLLDSLNTFFPSIGCLFIQLIFYFAIWKDFKIRGKPFCLFVFFMCFWDHIPKKNTQTNIIVFPTTCRKCLNVWSGTFGSSTVAQIFSSVYTMRHSLCSSILCPLIFFVRSRTIVLSVGVCGLLMSYTSQHLPLSNSLKLFTLVYVLFPILLPPASDKPVPVTPCSWDTGHSLHVTVIYRT